ncbi:MAG: hypothetical protein K0R07_1961 [Sedimentibacter sp.]|nr:hypothetical protein [Sedimentibacter sp.]
MLILKIIYLIDFVGISTLKIKNTPIKKIKQVGIIVAINKL